MQIIDIQRRLAALGLYSGKLDNDWGPLSTAGAKAYQRSRGLPITGRPDAKLIADMERTTENPVTLPPNSARILPASWLVQARLEGIVLHWTAGTNKASASDRKHYHVLVQGDGEIVRGIPQFSDNDERGITKAYAAHTLGMNTGWAGISMCGMAGAREAPFQTGPYPLTRLQWDRTVLVAADICRAYNIRPSRQTVLSHAEVQSTLGKKQRGKWDVARLSFDPAIVGAHQIGDRFRAEVSAKL